MANNQGSTSKDQDVVVEALLSTMDPNRRDSWQRLLRALDAQAQRAAIKDSCRGLEG